MHSREWHWYLIDLSNEMGPAHSDPFLIWLTLRTDAGRKKMHAYCLSRRNGAPFFCESSTENTFCLSGLFPKFQLKPFNGNNAVVQNNKHDNGLNDKYYGKIETVEETMQGS